VEDAELRHSLATASEFRNQAKALANITLYEQRLTRQFERTLEQLRTLQSERRKDQATQPVATPNGFVFSSVSDSPGSPASHIPQPEDRRSSAFIGGPMTP
jgi:hypothetical protein